MNAGNAPVARPLSRLRVLDLSTMIAAPLTASLLADYGADVVKVEQPGAGDHVRSFGPQKDGEGLYWKTLSRNKKSVALDLHLPQTQELMRRWVPQFDIVIENFRPGTLERWGLAPADLRRLSPQLVVLRVTAYGQDGPYRDRPGFGTLAEAMTGLATLSGFSDRPPLLPAFPLADIMAGHLGAAAVLAAIERRHHTGEGDCIDLAIYEAALKLIELNIIEYDQTGTQQERSGNRIGSSAPRGSYECNDGLWLALSGSTQSVAQRVLRTIGGGSMVEDPRFLTNADRVAHAAELDDYIANWCHARSREAAILEFTEMGCAVGPLESIETMLENPQVVARGSVARVHDPRLGQIAMSNVYPRFATADCRIDTTGPADVGQHTDEVLVRDLGLSDAELAGLRYSGAMGAPALAG